MIGVDSGVVVNLFVSDDPRQHEAARSLFRDAREDGGIFISSAALLETVWTLKTLYGYEDEAMKRMLLSLCSLAGTTVEYFDAVFAWASDEDTVADLADVLIAATNKKAGCERTVTFDKRAARDVAGMETLT